MSGLQVDSIRKNFGLRQVLNDIFISCQQGEIIGLLGRNGSGKSTLLKIIFGTVNAENRFVSIDDIPINSLFENQGLIHYLPQENFLPDHIKIKGVISLFCSRHQGAILTENELIRPFLNQKSSQLSGGERRVVEVLLMVHSEAKYLLFDEPFNGISPLFIEQIKLIITEHTKTKGFLITDHDYHHILEISSNIMLLHEGAIKRIKEVHELVEWGYLPQAKNRD
ncbi:ATP-binding cassette domain-containing protein [Pedobacter sp. PAMC26386]|nr:ATP-binding cassette domain-containing protein [Pedobacter sp. PAMC26386]